MSIPMSGESVVELYNALSEDTYYETKQEIVSYYQQTYQRKWRVELIKDLSQFTKTKPYNLRRRFDPDRIDRLEGKKQQEEYRKLGRALPTYKKQKDWRGKRAKVSATVYVDISKTKNKKKNIEVTLSSARTAELMGEGGIDAIIDQYGIEPDAVDYLDIGNITVDFI